MLPTLEKLSQMFVIKHMLDAEALSDEDLKTKYEALEESRYACEFSADRDSIDAKMRLYSNEMGRRNTNNKMTVQFAYRIYQILHESLDVPASYLDNFIHQQCSRASCSEYRIQGKLSFGGKFRRNNRRWYVNCYPEDLNATRASLMSKVDKLLAELKDEWHGTGIAPYAC